MPEYNCINIGTEGYPVWLTLSEKATIAAIEPTSYAETSMLLGVIYPLVTTVTLVVEGCCVEVKTPASVESVCRILGFIRDERDVVHQGEGKPADNYKPPPPEEAKPEGGGLQ